MWLDWGPLPPLRRGLLTSPLREWQARRALLNEWERRYGGRGCRMPPIREGLFVSLTSYAPRFGTLALTLRSLLLQDLRPEAVLRWIGHGDMAQLPIEVRGWLVASSQGDNAYSLYRLPGMEPAGRFRIGAGKFGATQETDGIEVALGDFGPDYPEGLVVVQDGVNPPSAQNFKLVSWRAVREALRLAK